MPLPTETTLSSSQRKDDEQMNGSIRIATIRGIPVLISTSWIIVFVLFLWSFAVSYYPDRYPGWTTQAYFAAGLATTLLFFASVVIHEFGHALTAARFGIRTRRITLLPIGGLAEIEREPDKSSQEFAIAIAGPVTSFLLGALFLGLYSIIRPFSVPLGGVAAYLGMANIALAIFNLIPGYPMDGGRVLRALVWGGGQLIRTRHAGRGMCRLRDRLRVHHHRRAPPLQRQSRERAHPRVHRLVRPDERAR